MAVGFSLLSSLRKFKIKNKHEVRGLQAFAFCVVADNDGYTKPRFK